MTITRLTVAMGGSTGSGRAMADHLEAAGLAVVRQKPGVAGKLA